MNEIKVKLSLKKLNKTYLLCLDIVLVSWFTPKRWSYSLENRFEHIPNILG